MLMVENLLKLERFLAIDKKIKSMMSISKNVSGVTNEYDKKS